MRTLTIGVVLLAIGCAGDEPVELAATGDLVFTEESVPDAIAGDPDAPTERFALVLRDGLTQDEKDHLDAVDWSLVTSTELLDDPAAVRAIMIGAADTQPAAALLPDNDIATYCRQAKEGMNANLRVIKALLASAGIGAFACSTSATGWGAVAFGGACVASLLGVFGQIGQIQQNTVSFTLASAFYDFVEFFGYCDSQGNPRP